MLKAEYIAGFFDGEGSVGLYASKSSGRHSLRVCVNQVVTPQSAVLFEELKTLFGGSLTYPKRQKSHHHQAVSWAIYGDKAVLFLRWIRPFLLLKLPQVDLVIDWQERHTGDRRRPKDPERQKERQDSAREVVAQLSPLKGPRKKG